jgi:type II secretory pathway component HofQ
MLKWVELKNLQCRGCKYCQKAHEAWTKFLLDVDEAVPLTKKKIIYGQQIDVSIAMIRLFGGEVLDDPSQDFNITLGLAPGEDRNNSFPSGST